MKPRLLSALVFGLGATAFVTLLNLTFFSGPSPSLEFYNIDWILFNVFPVLIAAGFGWAFGELITSRKNAYSARYFGVMTACLSLWVYILIIQFSSIEPCLFTDSCREYSWGRFWSGTLGTCIFLSIPVGFIGLICGSFLYKGEGAKR